MLSIKHKFLFVHIPKTGGNSIQNILAEYSDDRLICNIPEQDGVDRFELINDTYGYSKHSTLQNYFDKVPSEILEECFIFTCIRNPWERMISYYFSSHRQVSEWSRNAFIEMLDEVENSEHYLAHQPETYTLRDENYLRFENLDTEFRAICKKLSIPLKSLPHRNRSNHMDYRKYYDDELVELVAEKSKFEVNEIGYSFLDN